jgi:deoxyribodipyrimidine photolyase-like uncharacterized protein
LAGGGGALRVVLGDQCSRTLSALRDLDPATDVVLLAEVRAECTYVRHHKQKIALVLSAMRHFARALAARGVRVEHVRLEEEGNTGTLAGEVARAVERHRPTRIVATHPGEWRVLGDMRSWEDLTGLPVEIRDDDRFICPLDWFRDWAMREGGAGEGPDAPGQFRLEFFYRAMCRNTGLLMEGDCPAGGRWNFDTENRRRLPARFPVPEPRRFPPDRITREVIETVERCFPDHFGTLDVFGWPSPRATRNWRSTTSSPTACPSSATTRTPWPPASRPCSTASSPPASMRACSSRAPAARRRRRRGAPAAPRSTPSRASSARSSAGANTSAGSTGSGCRTTPPSTP